MDKKIAGLLGAAAAMTTATGVLSTAPAQASELATATTYRDLLDPIANALTLLKADDARLSASATTSGIQDVQWWRYRYRREHHHHHHHYRRREHHHHHHHHHSDYRV